VLEWKILDCSIDGEKEKRRIEKDIAATAGRNEAAGKIMKGVLMLESAKKRSDYVYLSIGKGCIISWYKMC